MKCKRKKKPVAISPLILRIKLSQEILDDFEKTEFWYIDEKKILENNAVAPLVTAPHRNVDKWWMPVPSLPDSGLSEKACKHLRQKQDCAYQIHKAALAINCAILAEMEIPESYTQALPKVRDDMHTVMPTDTHMLMLHTDV